MEQQTEMEPQGEMERQTEKKRIPVKGMTCAACSARVERVVGGLDGVDSAAVNLATEQLDVSWDPGAIDLSAMSDAVADAGFELALDEVGGGGAADGGDRMLKFTISGMTCAACSARVERVSGAQDGVASAAVNLAAETAQIHLEPGVDARAVAEAVKQAVADAGFGAEEVRDAGDGGPSETERLWEHQQQNTRERLAAMRARLVPAFGFSIPLLVLSMGEMLGMPLPAFLAPHTAPLVFALVQLALVLPVMWSGRDFYRVGFANLWRMAPNMDSLIAVGTGAAFVYSLWNTIEIALGVNAMERVMDLYFESAAVLIALVSLGKYFEARAKAHTSDAIKGLMELTPDTALAVRDGEEVEVHIEDIAPGELLRIKPGTRIPVDGSVVEGESGVDESMLTGESLPVTKHAGDTLAGGTMNVGGSFVMRAERVGSDTVLARIIRLVQDAQGSKAPIANMADRVSLYFVPTVMGIALLSGLAWLIGGATLPFSLRIFVAVMVIACPCAMGLATPTSIMVGTGRGAQLGVLVKSGVALEQLGRVQAMVFDKTGTLTRGEPSVTEILPVEGSGLSEDELLALAASAESLSEHPLATAVVGEARERELSLPAADGFEAVSGKGIRARVGDRDVLVGTSSYLRAENVTGVDGVLDQAQTMADRGATPLLVAVDGAMAGLVAVADTLRPETPGVVAALRKQGVRVVMLTGDNERTARAIARQAGMNPDSGVDGGEVFAQVLPEDKAAAVQKLKDEGLVVAMVGDGVNDAPALAVADVGIAMGTGIDVAVEAGDVVLMRAGLDSVLAAVGLSRATLRNIRQNLFWAFGYNVLGIPVAMGVLYLFGGPTLSPMIAGGAMALSSVSVVSNALRLRFWKPA